ncbi:MAG TPA: hypothetical protein VMP08_15565 [Anaerolineae bacterium]|nr:hypothetical protein [Anaerolineae bacterium]
MIVGLLVGVVLLAIAPLGLSAQSQAEQYFPETGHTVRGEFLDYFNAHGGLRIFGFPITEEFTLNGRTVQYFQRARLELLPEKPVGQRIQLGALGEELGKDTPPQPSPGANTYFQRYFTETGHSVVYAFLSFFDKNGGVDVFGYPISDYGSENGKGRIGQYFQRAKLEWYPELAPEQRVQLADLGSIHFDLLAAQGKVDPALKNPVAAPGQINDVPLSLKVSATTKDTITTRRDSQTLYVYVTDQKNMPVANAEVTFTLRDANGTQTYNMSPTDATGFTSYTFDAGAFRPAQVVFMTVNARSSGVTGTDRTSFFTWF